jgi:tetratricopeptide (TPR) repeat protein
MFIAKMIILFGYIISVISCKSFAANEHFNNGYANYKKNNYIDSFIDYSKAINLDPNNYGAYINRGTIRYDHKDYNGALEDFTKAIDLKPNIGEVYSNRGNTKFELKDYDGALNDYLKAIELSPKFTDAYYNLANLKANVYKKYNEAIKLYTIAIEIEPLSEAYNNRGIAKQDLNDINGAILDYQKAIELNPKNYIAYHNLAEIQLIKGLIDDAIINCTKSIQISNKYSDAYKTRSEAFKIKKEFLNSSIDMQLYKLLINEFK